MLLKELGENKKELLKIKILILEVGNSIDRRDDKVEGLC